MSGRWVRRVEDRRPQHRCQPPEQAEAGDIWQCDCDRRFTCVDAQTRRGNYVTCRADWARRYWPWPRLDQTIPVREVGLGVDPALVDKLLNGPRDRDGAREVRER